MQCHLQIHTGKLQSSVLTQTLSIIPSTDAPDRPAQARPLRVDPWHRFLKGNLLLCVCVHGGTCVT